VIKQKLSCLIILGGNLLCGERTWAADSKCANFFEQMEALFQENNKKYIKTVGDDFKIVPENDGKAVVLQFLDNAKPHPFDYYSSYKLDIPYADLKSGFSFTGPDGSLWQFVSIDAKGLVQFASGEKKLAWQSGYYAAHVHTVQLNSINHRIKLIVPALEDRSPDLPMLEKFRAMIGKLPENGVKNVETIRLHALPNRDDELWNKQYAHHLKWYNFWRKFESEATSGNKELNFYPLARKMDITPAALHELGHLIAESLYGTAVPDARWLEAMKVDGVAPSNYARNSAAEDFAETVRLYLETEAGLKGGILSRPAHQKLKARFALLDQVFGIHPEEGRALADQARNFRRILAAFSAVTTGGSALTLFYLGESR
jgi:hypothetical protein